MSPENYTTICLKVQLFYVKIIDLREKNKKDHK